LATKPFLSDSVPLKILPDLPSGFHYFEFRNKIFFKEQGCQSCAQLPNFGIRSLYVLSRGDRVTHVSQGCGRNILTRLDTLEIQYKI
jgi:hypothetical protein